MSEPTHAMLTAGARAIGNTMRWANHYERAAEIWRAMTAAQDNPQDLPAIPDARAQPHTGGTP